MSEELKTKIKELEEKIRLLEIENTDWTNRAEDVFLFATTAESISQLQNSDEIFESALEKISIMKNIPYCAFGTLGNGKINIEYEYSSYSEEDKSIQISLSSKMKAKLLDKLTIIETVNNKNPDIKIKVKNNNFNPVSCLIHTYTNLRNEDGIFICLDEDDTDRLDTIRNTLLHSVTLVNSRLDNLILINKITEQNKNLESRIAESMGELEEEIKEHIKTEEYLRKSEEKYRTLADYTFDWEYWVDETGNYKYISPAFEKLTGYTTEALTENPKLLYDIIHQEFREEVKEHYSELPFNENNEKILQFKIITKSGEVKWVGHHCVPVYDSNGNFIGRRGSNRDITERKKAEIELRKKEEYFRLITEHAFDFIWMLNMDMNITYASNSAQKILGYSKEEILKIHTSKLYTPDDFTKILSLLETELSKGAPHEGIVFQSQNIRKDGTIFPVEIGATIFYDSNNAPTHIQGYTRDISEQVEWEEELRLSEEKYRRFLENNDAVILMIDPSTQKITFANNSAVKFYGYGKENLIGMPISNINTMPPEEIKKRMKSALEHNQNYYVFKHRLASGELKDVEVYQNKFTHNKKPLFSLIIHDISQRKLAERNLRKFKLGIEQSTEAVFITETDGTITYVNPAFETTYGFSFEDAVGKKPNILKSGVVPDIVYKDFWDALINKESVDGEIINKTKEGKLIHIDGNNSPILSDNGELIGFIGIHRDITERKINEEELIESKRKAESASKMKSVFLAQMSHEIRTPINTVVSTTSLLKYDLEETVTEEQANSFDIIERAGARIIRTIDLLLNLSEVQAGTYEPDNTTFDLFGNVILSVVAENKLIAKKKNIALTIENKVDDTRVFADLYTVNQIFIQIIENAIKYTAEGEVKILINRDDENRLQVVVQDTGIGISSEYLPNLFEPFSQEEMGYTRKYDGNGIGLALVKTYCELNNAKIEVESIKGVGSTFKVIFY